MQNICYICRQKNDTTKLGRLNRLLSLLRSGGLIPADYAGYNWNINTHCRYGIACPQLRSYDSRCRQVSREIDPYLNALAVSENVRLYCQVLDLLRGEFPMVYKELERKRRIKGGRDVHNWH